VVLLRSGECGVVMNYDKQSGAPQVLALFTANDQLYDHPPKRLCLSPEFAIQKVLDNRIIAGAMPLAFIWGKDASKNGPV
jgi:hypothetical protein